MENYFILLELPFDPPESNSDVIEEAINKKVQQWQNESKNPKKTVIAKEKLEEVPNIKRVMLDPSLRMSEAAKATEFKNRAFKDMSYDIMLKESKGIITSKDIDDLEKKYSQYGFSRDVIISKITVPIDGSSAADNSAKLPESVIKQLETYFSNLNIDDMSIYVFLGVSENAKKEDIISAADKKLQFLLQKGEKSSQDEMYQKIAGIAKHIFSSEDLADGYVNYVSGGRYYRLNNLISNGAAENDGIINHELFRVLLRICAEEYDMTGKVAAGYIMVNCRNNGYQIDNKMVADVLKQYAEQETTQPVEEAPKPEKVEPENNKADERPDFFVNMENRINLLTSEIRKLSENLSDNDNKFRSNGLVPSLLCLKAYIGVVVVVLSMHLFVCIQFNQEISQILKNAILLISILLFADGVYNGYLLYKTYMYEKFYGLFFLSQEKYNSLINEKYTNIPFTLDEIKRRSTDAIDYLNNIMRESDTLYRLCFNMRQKAIKFLNRFKKQPYGYLLIPRIIFVSIFTIMFYYVILRYFPKML